VTALVAQFLADVHALGGADWDWCSLMERQRRLSSPGNRSAPDDSGEPSPAG
jgi:hypothetical protein